jgi:hypothetical protein
MLVNRDEGIQRCLFVSAEFCAARCAVAEHGSALQGKKGRGLHHGLSFIR